MRLISVLIAGSAILLSACGTKGPLYLPQPANATSAQPAGDDTSAGPSGVQR